MAILNKEQEEAAQFLNGCCMVSAVPGGGKTRTMTERIGKLILEHGVKPANILGVTFTRKAAGEMKDRIVGVLGANVAKGVRLTTIHSFCSQTLRKEGYEFTVLEGFPQLIMIKGIIKRLGYRSEVHAGEAIAHIGWAKNNLVSPEKMSRINDTNAQRIANVYAEYEKIKEREFKIDFTDMLVKVYHLFKDHPDVRARYRNKYRHILVDEYQDTNPLQLEIIKMLVEGSNGSLWVCGDLDQCWHGSCKVKTTQGIKRVEDLAQGDIVPCAYKGAIAHKPIKVIEKQKSKPLIRITTESEKVTHVSYDHRCFVTYPEFNDTIWYLYLMYRQDLGFRIGMLSGGSTNNLRTRMNVENPDRLWLLERCSNEAEAATKESILSLRYQIPKTPYKHSGRGIRLTDKAIQDIFQEFGDNGLTLLIDKYNYRFDYPHYEKHSEQSVSINLIFNQAEHSNQHILVRCENNGKRVRKGFDDYVKARQFAKQLLNEMGAHIIAEKFRMPKYEVGGQPKFLGVVPANQLLVSMSIPVINNGQIVLDKITSLEEVDDDIVYEIEVTDAGNMIADGMVTHNSIYGFTGADVDTMLEFDEIFGGSSTQFTLFNNYRSTPEIIDGCNLLIKHNQQRFNKAIVAVRKSGKAIRLLKGATADEEALNVADEIETLFADGTPYESMAAIYRTNAQSRAFEEILYKRKIPYYLVRSTNFYQRREVRILINYLRLIEDPLSETGDHTLPLILNHPGRYIGKKFIAELKYHASNNDMYLYQALSDMPIDQDYLQRNVTTFLQLLDPLIMQAKTLKPVQVIDHLRKRTNYDRYITEDTVPSPDDIKVANINQLQIASTNHETLTGFLDFVHKMENQALQKESKKKKKGVALMTIHCAKGLEYPVVFVVGMHSGLMPHPKAADERQEEERRICYVGISRAMDILYLSYYTRNMENEVISPSLYLKEITQRNIPVSVEQDNYQEDDTVCEVCGEDLEEQELDKGVCVGCMNTKLEG